MPFFSVLIKSLHSTIDFEIPHNNTSTTTDATTNSTTNSTQQEQSQQTVSISHQHYKQQTTLPHTTPPFHTSLPYHTTLTSYHRSQDQALA